ncbi:hypothetical protein [uncultured Draconibacterium sp.]|uniref:hypothetical protein n=1 Tax=uncultured Draconibacterium sp. TaxID=1573823 RepID=UPI00374A4E03
MSAANKAAQSSRCCTLERFMRRNDANVFIYCFSFVPKEAQITNLRQRCSILSILEYIAAKGQQSIGSGC